MRPGEAALIVLELLFAAMVLQAAIGNHFFGSTKAGVPDSVSSTSSAHFGDLTAVPTDENPAFGAESNPTGSPIGGGEGYRNGVAPPDPEEGTIVATADELLEALSSARSGDIIYIDEMARIDLTDTPGGVTIPGGVTLAGNRGERRTAGSAVYPFEIEEQGEYFFWVRSSAPDEEESRRVWVSIDGEGTWRWDLEPGSDWHWSWGGAHYLSGGRHNLTVHWREHGLKVDEILITGDADYHPDAVTGEVQARIEAESGELSPLMGTTQETTASGGAYISITDDPDRDEYPPSPGGTIFLGPTAPDNSVGLIAGGEHVRITGIRLEGPDTGTETVDRQGLGIHSGYRNLEVDNCEISGWSGAAIGIAGTGGSDMKIGGYVHHNFIHHCQMNGLGYGVLVSGGGTALIEANYFDYCRHAIAGSGVAGDGYEARYNICGPNFIADYAFQFDMHGQASGSGTVAGDTIRIHHNTFMVTDPLDAFPIAIRGVPRDGAYIDHNWFYYTLDAPVWQTGGNERVYVTDNLIGEERVLSTSGPIKYY